MFPRQLPGEEAFHCTLRSGQQERGDWIVLPLLAQSCCRSKLSIKTSARSSLTVVAHELHSVLRCVLAIGLSRGLIRMIRILIRWLRGPTGPRSS